MLSKKKPAAVPTEKPTDDLAGELRTWLDRWRMTLNIEAAAQLEQMLSGHKS